MLARSRGRYRAITRGSASGEGTPDLHRLSEGTNAVAYHPGPTITPRRRLRNRQQLDKNARFVATSYLMRVRQHRRYAAMPVCKSKSCQRWGRRSPAGGHPSRLICWELSVSRMGPTKPHAESHGNPINPKSPSRVRKYTMAIPDAFEIKTIVGFFWMSL